MGSGGPGGSASSVEAWVASGVPPPPQEETPGSPTSPTTSIGPSASQATTRLSALPRMTGDPALDFVTLADFYGDRSPSGAGLMRIWQRAVAHDLGESPVDQGELEAAFLAAVAGATGERAGGATGTVLGVPKGGGRKAASLDGHLPRCLARASTTL